MSDRNIDDDRRVSNGGRTEWSSGTGVGVNRRQFVAGLGAGGAIGLAGCGGPLGSVSGGPEQITMLLTPDTPSDVRPQYKPVQNMLEGEVDGIELEMKVPQDYSAIRPALESEQAEIGMDDVTLISNPDLMDLFGTAVTGGTAFYFSMMVTNPDSSIDEQTDLEGKRVAFADRLSTSGSIFAVYTLKQSGLDVGDAPDGKPVDFEGVWSNHEVALEKLGNGDADAACTWSGNGLAHLPEDHSLPDRVRNRDSFVGTMGNETPQFRAFWWSFPIPKQPVYARSSWESDKKREIGNVLRNSNTETMRQYYPDGYDEDILPFSRVKKTTIENYQPVIKRLNALDIELGG